MCHGTDDVIPAYASDQWNAFQAWHMKQEIVQERRMKGE